MKMKLGKKRIVQGKMIALRAAMLVVFTVMLALSGVAGMREGKAATFSQYWYQDAQGNWKIRNGNGAMVTNAWLCDDAVPENGKEVWYLIGADGNMITAPLVQDLTGNYYSLETQHNGYYGMLRYKSGVYDGLNLLLENSHNGSFAKILNADAVAALMANGGVTVVNIDNGNCVYTSSFASAVTGTTSRRTGGSSGGGGGSSGGSSGSGRPSGGGSSGGSSGGNSGGGSSGGSTGGNSSTGGGSNGGNSTGGGSTGGSGSSGGNSGNGSTGGNSGGGSSEDDKFTSDDSISYGANDFEHGNYSMMTQSEKEELQAAIDDFKKEYLRDDMSELEKELIIIWWLSNTCTYGSTSTTHGQTAYDCIIRKRALCAGYADAFLQVAKACGLDARFVRTIDHPIKHAWNLVKIENEWYHVDVTWEDEDGDIPMASWKNMHNEWINLTDDEIKVRPENDYNHANWTPQTIAANGSSHGGTVVAYYQLTGEIDTEMKGDKWREYLMKNNTYSASMYYTLNAYGYRFDDDSNYFEGSDMKSRMIEYLDKVLSSGQGLRAVYLTFPAGADLSWLSEEWLNNNLGSGIGSTTYISIPINHDPAIDVREIDTYHEQFDYVSLAEQKAIYDKAFQETDGVILTTEQQGKELAEQKFAERATRYVAIYEGGEPLYQIEDLRYWHNSDISWINVTKHRVAVGGKQYLIEEYELIYWK